MPPKIQPETSKPIQLEDIDGAVKRWFRDVMASKVPDPGGAEGTMRSVHVTFSTGERWVAAADRQGVRDKDGRLILPVIEIMRNGVGLTEHMSALGANVPTMQVARLVSKKTADLANADSNRPISERRLRDSAVYDIYTIPFPVSNTLPYKVRIQAQYEQQMNVIVQKILQKLEFFDVPCFILEIDGNPRPQGIKVGQGKSEILPADHQRFVERDALSAPYVVAYIEGDLTSEGQTDFTDGERLIQIEFSFKVPSNLQLDSEGIRPAVQKERTAFTLSLDVEVCHSVDDLIELDDIFGPK